MYGRVVENQPTIWIIGNWLIFPALLSATTLGPMHFILTTHYSLTNQYATLHYTTLHCTALHCTAQQIAAKNAAKILGYEKKTWDSGATVDAEDCDWDELTKEQKKAAVVLGYDEASWDTD